MAMAASAWDTIGNGLKPRPLSSRTTARSIHFRPISAVGFGDDQREPAEICCLLPQFTWQAAVLSSHDAQRAGVGHETQNLLPQQVLLFGEAEVHAGD